MIEDQIIFQDKHFIAFYKKAGTPIIADQSLDLSSITALNHYVGQEMHIINRLDRPVSGLAIAAMPGTPASSFSAMVKKREIIKTYYAAVEGKPRFEKGDIQGLILKRKNKAILVNKNSRAKNAALSYEYITSSDSYHFLKIKPQTGRFHQIRAQLASIGCPIKGDVKYGARRANKDRSIHLHAYSLEFKHPFTGENTLLIAPLPKDPVWEVLSLTLS